MGLRTEAKLFMCKLQEICDITLTNKTVCTMDSHRIADEET